LHSDSEFLFNRKRYARRLLTVTQRGIKDAHAYATEFFSAVKNDPSYWFLSFKSSRCWEMMICPVRI